LATAGSRSAMLFMKRQRSAAAFAQVMYCCELAMKQ